MLLPVGARHDAAVRRIALTANRDHALENGSVTVAFLRWCRSGDYLTASAPAFAICASWWEATPDTPIAPIILPSAIMGRPPSARHAPKVKVLKPTPPPASASSSALVGRRNSTEVHALSSAIRPEESCALSNRCSITRLPPESTTAIATAQLFFTASASAADAALFAASNEMGAPYGVVGGATCD